MIGTGAARLADATNIAPVIQPLAEATGVFSYLWLLIALPLLGATVLLLGGRRTNRWGPYFAVLMVVVPAAYGIALLVGMILSAFAYGALLQTYSPGRLIQVIQGAAVVTIVVNVIALWKQEARNPALTAPTRETPTFSELWNAFVKDGRNARLLTAIGIGHDVTDFYQRAVAIADVEQLKRGSLREPYSQELLAAK